MNGISGAVASGASRHAVLMVAACRSSSLFVAEIENVCEGGHCEARVSHAHVSKPGRGRCSSSSSSRKQAKNLSVGMSLLAKESAQGIEHAHL